jgi:hypothetical protein
MTDRQYMGTADDAKAALIDKSRVWRDLRQPRIDTPRGHRKVELQEQEARFQLANAAMLWLWHEENPGPRTDVDANATSASRVTPHCATNILECLSFATVLWEE